MLSQRSGADYFMCGMTKCLQALLNHLRWYIALKVLLLGQKLKLLVDNLLTLAWPDGKAVVTIQSQSTSRSLNIKPIKCVLQCGPMIDLSLDKSKSTSSRWLVMENDRQPMATVLIPTITLLIRRTAGLPLQVRTIAKGEHQVSSRWATYESSSWPLLFASNRHLMICLH